MTLAHLQRLIHEAIWQWHLGQPADFKFKHAAQALQTHQISSFFAEPVPELAAGLRSDDELTALNSAYCLAALGGPEAAAVLVGALPEVTPPNKDWSGNGNGGTDTASAAGYGLCNSDSVGVSALRRLLADSATDTAVLRIAIYTANYCLSFPSKVQR